MMYRTRTFKRHGISIFVSIWLGLLLTILFKIAVTILLWGLPLLLPSSVLKDLGFPSMDNYMFVRMLGCAYLALSLGYIFAYLASRNGKRPVETIWVGIVSNGSACICLIYYGTKGSWSAWSGVFQFVLWGSIVATALITVGLYRILSGLFVDRCH